MNSTEEQSRQTGPVRVRRSRSALLYLSLMDRRGGGPRTPCCRMREERDRQYGHRFRYGTLEGVTHRRVDRADPARSLY